MKRILIIEDDSLIADVYQRKLSAEGLAVEVAADGKRGLDSFNNRRPDLILLDLLLPEVNGVELLKAVRSEFNSPELPVIVLTNAYLGGVIQQAWEAGANQVIPKIGLKLNMIVQMVKNALETPPPAAVLSAVEYDPELRRKFLESSSKTLHEL